MYTKLKTLQRGINLLIADYHKKKNIEKEADDACAKKNEAFRYYSKRLRFNIWIQIASALFGSLLLIAGTAYLWKIKQLTTISLVLGSVLYTFVMFGILGICKYYQIRDRMLRDKAFAEIDIMLDRQLVIQTQIGDLLTVLNNKLESFKIMKGKVHTILKHAKDLNIQAVPREDQEDMICLLELCGSDYYIDMVVPILDMDNKQLTKLTSPSQLN